MQQESFQHIWYHYLLQWSRLMSLFHCMAFCVLPGWAVRNYTIQCCPAVPKDLVITPPQPVAPEETERSQNLCTEMDNLVLLFIRKWWEIIINFSSHVFTFTLSHFLTPLEIIWIIISAGMRYWSMQFHAGRNQAVEPLKLMQIACFYLREKKGVILRKNLYIG